MHTMIQLLALRRPRRDRLRRGLAALIGFAALASWGSAQNPGEILRAIKIPGSHPGAPVLTSGDSFGRGVCNVGDIDGDGVIDLLVGASSDADGTVPGTVVMNAGAAWLIFLQSDGTPRESVKYSNLTPGMPVLEAGDYFGKAVTGIGDLDGDGVRDIAVGAPGDDDGVTDHGAVYILFLNADGSIKARQKISATEGGFTQLYSQSEFGRALSPLGDLDGDGVLDLAASRMPRASIKWWPGTVYVLFMNADGTVRARRAITLADVGLDYVLDNRFGFSLSTRDLNGDGTMDLMSGDLTYDGYPIDGATNPGCGAVFFITLDPNGQAIEGWRITGGEAGFNEILDPADHWGSGVDAPEIDFDGDGIYDLVVGRKRDDDTSPGGNTNGSSPFCPFFATECLDRGAAYILFMNSDGRTVRDFQKISDTEGNFPWVLDIDDRFGQSVDTLGDLNGDGFMEVAISARWDDDAAPGSGIVYICTISDGTIVPTTASFTASPTTGDAPLEVTFTDTSTGTLLDSWAWDFGDGGTSTEQHPLHTYTSPGTYTVQLDVDGLSGQARRTRNHLIVVDSAFLDVDFDAAPTLGEAPLDVQFTDFTLGGPVSWAWDFGDGGTSTEQHPLYTYTVSGDYSVTLTVTDDALNTAELTKPDLISVGGDHFIRLGCDPAAMNTLTVISGTPELGQVLRFGIDNPHGTQAAGSMTSLRIAFAAQPTYPCGLMFPNYGMEYAGASGEVMLTLFPSPLSFAGTAFGGAGVPGVVTLPIPTDPSYVGMRAFCQGVIIDPIAAQGVRFGVTDGLEFVLR